MAEQDVRGDLALTSQGFGNMPVLNQVGFLMGIAASIAIGGAVAFWAQTPNYHNLYSGLAAKDVMAVTDALQKIGVPFEMSGTGTVRVPGDQVDQVKIKLAAQGLPNSQGEGFELLDKDQGFGTSQFMEKARYQRALEGELSRTISTMRNVENARVHLAIPKQNFFLRDKRRPSASVMLNLYAGRNIDEGQVAAIVHMVASSIPNLESDKVTVVDQRGRLLTMPDAGGAMGLSSSNFSHRKNLEAHLTEQIEKLITPIVGIGGIRAQVTTELDFSVTEETQETFNPDLPAVRSEQSRIEESSGGGSVGGVPGALTNQPPEDATAETDLEAAQAINKRSNTQTIKNYELNRVISHVKLPGGTLKRLSVAVVVDDRQTVGDGGEVTREAWTEEELARITTLVKQAVGFNEDRGDTVSVINASFTLPETAEALPEIPVYEQPWVMDIAKMVLGVIAVLFSFFLLRSTLKSLTEKGRALPSPAVDMGQLSADQQLAIANSGGLPQLPGQVGGGEYEQNLNSAKSMVQQDPKRVAQVVKQWVGDDG
ncbi:Flagellar M-ring protein FliF [hydrothermal vent metagenome]|uniref:Flagellar M-ring protein FliF n=1 Tax=hydrothermal vent metagenome TaxID=652676 RepID=A0A3B0YYA7_9ZZZZ